MTGIKQFTETDFEFQEVTRLYNLVSHDDQEHVDDMKEGWQLEIKVYSARGSFCTMMILY